MRLRLLAVVLCLALPSTAAAAETWTYASSDHFEVYTTAGPKEARDVLAYFERVHAFFTDFMHLTPKQARPTRVIVFSGEREYKPYRPNEAAIAYYRPGPDRDYIVMESFDPDAYPIVVHEYAHLIARHSGQSYPPWLSEGVAEFFSTLSPLGGQMTIGRVPRGRLQELSVSALLPLPQLVAVSHDSPEYNSPNRAGVFYAESWALTHMLWMQDGYRGKMQSFLDTMAQGATAEAAFQKIYGRTMAQVAGDLTTYVKSTTFRYFTTSYRDPKPASAYEPHAVTPFDARLMTTTLLAEGAETEVAARAALSDLEREQPESPQVSEVRAYLELRHGHPDAAAPFIAKAIEHGSTNPTLYRDAAGLATSPTEAATLLGKAVALDPDDVELRIRYAGALLNNQRAAESLKALEPIKNLPLDQAFFFFQVAANGYMATDQFDNARASAAKAGEYAEAGYQADTARRLVQSIDDFLARRAAAEQMARSAAAASAAPPDASPRPNLGNSLNGEPTTSRGETPFADVISVVRGRIRKITCDTKPIVVELVQADRTIVRFVIDDPQLMTILGKGSITTDLACGDQSTNVRLGYEPMPDERLRTLGVVRLLDFR